MTINIHLPPKTQNLKPTITVVGVGGAGGNAVNNMIASSLEGVNFVVANTDAQSLENSFCEKRIQLGARVTQGLGAGASPQVGGAAAEESLDEIESHIIGSNMVFITAGMGGGTGTGAAPVIAKLAKDNNILTVGVITKPFHFEGAHRMRVAESGISELQKYVDTLIVIPNQNLFRLANEKTTFADAFKMADDVLHAGVRGITDLMIMPGLINLDFADIRTVMSEMGKAMMGTGEAEGERRAIDAAEAAISNPLLDDISMKGARGVLINITGGPDLTLFEVDEAANRIREEVDPDANIIFGSTFNKDMSGKIRVSVVSTGIGLDKALKEAQAAAPSVFGERKPHASQILQNVFSANQQKPAPKAEFVRQQEQQPAMAEAGDSEKKSFDSLVAEVRKEANDTAGRGVFAAQQSEQPQQQQPQQVRVEQKLQPERVVVSQVRPAQAPQQKDPSLSFLQKLGIGKQQATVGKVEQKSPSVSKESRIAETADGGPTLKTRKTMDDDYLEVPAFLRRQSSDN